MIALLAAAALCFGEDEEAMHKLVDKGTVASLSTNFKGTPFGSLAPYALDKKGTPFVFLSDLAQHTKNLEKTKKASLMVHEVDKDDVYSSPRIVFVGKLKIVPDEEREDLAKIYVKRNPQSEQILNFGDFNFYRLEPTTIHYIGGFGDINWVTPAVYYKSFKGKK